MSERIVVSTANAPGAIGPYSQAIKAGGLVFISGQLPIDMSTGELCAGTIAEATTCCLNNAAAIAKEAGTDLARAVKTTILLTDMGDFAEVNAAYGKFFPSESPARACYAVAALPKDAHIEIEVICAL